MKKAYLSLVVVCVIPLLALSIVVGDLSKKEGPVAFNLPMDPIAGISTQA